MQRLAEEFHTLLVAGSNPAPATNNEEYENAFWNGISVYFYGDVFCVHPVFAYLLVGIGLAGTASLELAGAGNLRPG